MEEIESICFEIISSVGMARSNYIEAIQEAKTKNFDKAYELMKSGEENYLRGHLAHQGLIQKEATDPVKVSLLLVHAEDQLMQADGFKFIAREFIELYEKM